MKLYENTIFPALALPRIYTDISGTSRRAGTYPLSSGDCRVARLSCLSAAADAGPSGGASMLDSLMIALALALFALSILYAFACDRL